MFLGLGEDRCIAGLYSLVVFAWNQTLRLEVNGMKKPGIVIEIPGFGTREIHTVISDYTGTLSTGGRLGSGVRDKLLKLLESVDISVISSDSFGTAASELAGIVEPEILRTNGHDMEKRDYATRFDLGNVAAFGNGNNDRLLLKAVKEGGGLAIAVDNGERLCA
ncbi:MAG: HAD family hydrolase [Candidatus Acidiferrales bacterium]